MKKTMIRTFLGFVMLLQAGSCFGAIPQPIMDFEAGTISFKRGRFECEIRVGACSDKQEKLKRMFWVAIHNGLTPIVEPLLGIAGDAQSRAALVNASDVNRRHALHYVCQKLGCNGFTDVNAVVRLVEILIANGANIYELNDGAKPLHYAFGIDRDAERATDRKQEMACRRAVVQLLVGKGDRPKPEMFDVPLVLYAISTDEALGYSCRMDSDNKMIERGLCQLWCEELGF